MTDENAVVDALYDLGLLAYENARNHGFYDNPEPDGTRIALMHSELSEALEAIRHGNPHSEKIPAFTGFEEEMADLVIRVLDHCHYSGARLGQAVIAKMAYNAGRPYMHGKKF